MTPILADPSKHANKIYNIISSKFTFGDIATAFSDTLGKQVKYGRVYIPNDFSRKATTLLHK